MSQTTEKYTISSSYNSDALTWHPLRQISIYRLILSLGFLVAFYQSDLMNFLGSQNPQAFIAIAIALLISSLLFIFFSHKQTPGFQAQVIISNASDIILITLLSHFSGGLSSSLSVLLIINVTATGTFLSNRDSILFAALASIAVLSEQTYSLMSGISEASEYTRAGILGTVFFGTSFLAAILSQRVRESEQLAVEREADILNLEKLNEDIIQNMRTGIIVVDSDGHIQLANSSAEHILGNIDLKGKPLLENILPSLDARFLEWQEQPSMHHKSIRQGHGLPDIQPGFRKLSSSNDAPSHTLVFLEDATQLNQRFQQIKLASLGRLTASIAHEIRNPLSAINHAAQLLDESKLDAADKKLTNIITTQVLRLDKVVQNVLQLSRQQQKSQETINLNEWLTNFKSEYCSSHKISEKQLTIEIQSKDINILFDSSHLEQVINNLVSNAINHNDKPIKEVKISIVGGCDEDQHQPYIEIIDNGPGIDQDKSQQIFDPFFTTHSKGTGLGLYISKEILESNRAKIRYTQPPQGGSCFRIQFISSI